MINDKIELSTVTSMTKCIFNAFCTGDVQPWFDMLCPESVYIGTGEPMLFGGDAIKEHFKKYAGTQPEILSEEYYPTALGDQAAQVHGQIIFKSRHKDFHVVAHITSVYRIIGGELKLIHQHNSYDYMQDTNAENVKPDINTMQFVRTMLLELPRGKRIPIRSGKSTVFINTNSVLYIESERKRTKIVCIDRVISCNSPLGELAKELPKQFYQLHRSYIVNTKLIVAIRRYEVQLLSGITVPIPSTSFTKVKADLQNMIAAEKYG
ncbi:MAG: LytTR family transcriptional regulator DNA-binding domain-containing protein [Acutalibacteraceae bacterium]